MICLAAGGGFVVWRGVHAGAGTHGPATALPRLLEVPQFTWMDQDQTVVTNQTLQGRVWIADFIFTRCTTVCPLLTGKMTLLRRAIEHPGVTFVSFSVDPEHDTPEVLRDYAARWGGGPNWLLLQTAPGAIADFARAMGAPVRQVEDAQNPIIHSDKFFLVDQGGWVRGAYDSNDAAAVQQLIAAAAALTRDPNHAPPAAPQPAVAATAGDDAAQGMALYHDLGCAGCHENPKVAPPLAGVAQRHARPDGSMSAMDAEFIRQSIVEPEAEVTLGYATSMPSYRGQITAAEVERLVAYIATLAGPGPGDAAASASPASSGAATQVIDPVCKMRVAARQANTPFESGGTTYYFCSEFCRDQFKKSPQSYLRAE